MKRAKLLLCSLLVVLLLTSVAYADTYKNGSSGKAVEGIQQQLKKLGIFQGEITGYFGSQTETAVKKFQVKRGLHADGVVGQGTYKYLFENASKTQSSSAVASNSKNVMTIRDIQTALKKLGYYTGKVDGVSGNKTEAAIEKFQKVNKLAADGVVGQATKDKIVAALAKSTTTASKESKAAVAEIPVKVEEKTITAVAPSEKGSEVKLLDWWTEASKIFKLGTKAKVTDVRTGITFNIVRTYGSSHADSETLTAEDTKAMKKAWGGKWSWERRPVIVEVDGVKMAASIAAMPHAGVDSATPSTYVSNRSGGFGRGNNLDKVKENGMSGVVDVHFLNSKTHGTNRVDSNHQKAIKEAAKFNN